MNRRSSQDCEKSSLWSGHVWRIGRWYWWAQGLGSHTRKFESVSVFLFIVQSLVTLALPYRLKLPGSPLIPLHLLYFYHIQANSKSVDFAFKIYPSSGFSSPPPPPSPSFRPVVHCPRQVLLGLGPCSLNFLGFAYIVCSFKACI